MRGLFLVWGDLLKRLVSLHWSRRSLRRPVEVQAWVVLWFLGLRLWMLGMLVGAREVGR